MKIPREIKEKFEKAGVSPSNVTRKALMEAVKEIELKELEKEIEKFKAILNRIPTGRVVESIREDREK